MIFLVIMALIVLVYFFGLTALSYVAGLLAVLYACAVISARRSSARNDQQGSHKSISASTSTQK